MRALWQLLGCPPSPLFSSSLPPPCRKKKKKCDGREGERGRRNDSGLDGWWWMKQWRCSSGAAVWCWEIWRRVATVSWTSQSPPTTCLLCLVWLIYSNPWDKNINILMPNKMCFTYMTWMKRTHLWCLSKMNISNKILKKKKTALTIFFTSWHCIFFFFFLLISYKISLDWYTLILLLTT